MVSRDDIAIQAYDPDGKLNPDRGVLCGATGAGKSTLASVLINLWYQDFVKSERYPEARILVVDSKPRWRAEHLVHRFARKPDLDSIPDNTIKHSVLVRDTKEWDRATHDGRPVVVLQNSELDVASLIEWQTGCMNEFFRTQRPDIPSLLYIDEGMDFFGPSGTGKYGDVIQRCYRAGREKGMATFTGVQRPKQINLQVLTESNYLALFKLRFESDVTRLYEMGYPVGLRAPEQKRHFALWRDDVMVTADATLRMSTPPTQTERRAAS